MKPALVLFSGGLDSTTTLLAARREGFAPTALVFRYGQRHRIETDRAFEICERLEIPWRLQEIDLRSIGGSALTSDAIDVPLDRDPSEIAAGPIPPTYVPARNTIFLSLALAWAEVLHAGDIFCGVNALDYSGYPDCRPEYIAAFEALANLACRSSTEGGSPIRIHTPLIRLNKAQIVRLGSELGVEFERTWSCYAPVTTLDVVVACGHCDSCRLRRRGFAEAGISDPTPYAEDG